MMNIQVRDRGAQQVRRAEQAPDQAPDQALDQAMIEVCRTGRTSHARAREDKAAPTGVTPFAVAA